MFRSWRLVAPVSVATLLAVHPVPCVAEETAKPPAPPAAAEKATPTLTSVSCKDLEVRAAWKGPGVGIVDVYGKGEPVLQLRKDPQPDGTSVEIQLGKEWQGRSIDVRIWDKDAKLLDLKSTECASKP